MVDMVERFGDEETPSIIDWSFSILKRWKIALLVFFITFCISAYSTYVAFKKETPIYKSSATIMLGPEMIEIELKGRQKIRRKYSISAENNLLESDIIARQAAKILEGKLGYKESLDNLANETKGSLRVMAVKDKDNTLLLTTTSGDRQRAYDIICAVLEGYEQQKKEDQENLLQEIYKTITAQLDASYKNLMAAENALGEFIATNKEIVELMGNYGIDEQATKDFIAATLNENYLKIKAKAEESQKFYNTIKEKALTDRAYVISELNRRSEELKWDFKGDKRNIANNRGNIIDEELKKSLFKKEEELNQLLLVNEEAHPEVAKARGELQSITNQIDLEIKAAIDSLREELEDLKAKEKGLLGFIESGLHKKIIEYNMLKRDITVKRQIYDKLAEELQTIKLDAKIENYTETRIIQSPKLASTYTNTFPSRKIAYGLIMSLICSVVSVYAVETFDTSIKSIEQLEKLIDLPVLATIPSYRKHKPRRESDKKTER